MSIAASAILAKAVEGTLTSIAKQAAARAWSGLNPTQRRSQKRVARLAALLNSLDFSNRVSLLGLVDQLPSGVSLARVERTLSALEIQGVLHEAVAAHIVGTNPERRRIIQRTFVAVFTQLMTEVDAADAGRLAENVFDRIDSALATVMNELQGTNNESFAQLQAMAAASLINSTLEATARHNESQECYRDRAHLQALESWKLDYRRQVISEHGFIEPPDFERKRKVPMEQLYVAPRIRQGGIAASAEQELGIAEFSALVDRTVLLGDPGGGKSTAANYLAYTHAKGSDSRIPFFVILRDFARDEDLDKSIVDYISARCATLYQCKPPEGGVEHLLLSGQALVIFDGLDELIDTSKRRDVTRRVELFSERYPLASALVTSRRVGYEQAQLDPQLFQPFHLSGFNGDDVAQYVDRWFSIVEDLTGADLEAAKSSFIEESKTVPDLTSTPLMLALLCIIYRGQGFIPRNRPAVYEHCALLLFEKWDSSRKIFVELRVAAQVDAAIKHLAYWMLTEQAGAEAVSESDLVSEAAEYLRTTFEDSTERRRAAQEFVEFCRGRAWVLSDAGTTADGEALFKFTHRTFMEYFAAYELTRRADGPDQLAKALLPRIAAQEWDVVGQLAVQIANKHSKDGAERIFNYFLADRRRRSVEKRDNIHTFIWRCLSFTHVSPNLLRDLTQASLESSYNVRGLGRSLALVEGAPSIAHSVGVLSDARLTVGEALLGVLLPMVAGGDPDRISYSKSVLMSWHVVPVMVEVNTPSSEFWTDWADEVATKNLKLLLASGPGQEDAWLLALLRGLVSMDDYLDASRAWSENILDGLFRSQRTAPLGFTFADWAAGRLRPSLLRSEALSKRAHLSVELRLEQLRQLGKRLTPPPELPWVSRCSRLLTPQLAGDDWGPVDDEDVHWALWAVFACLLEASERASDKRRRGTEFPLAERIMAARALGEAPTDLFDGTMFESFTGDRRPIRDGWASGALNLLVPPKSKSH